MTERDGDPRFGFVVWANGPVAVYTELLSSLQSQREGSWQIFVVGGGSVPLLEAESRVTSLPSEPTLTAAVDAVLERGDIDWLTVATLDGQLSDTALEELSTAVELEKPDVIYSNESTGWGRDGRVLFKPDLSPERLRSQYYLGDFVFYRAGFLRDSGGLDASLPGAELYDLALRASRSDAKFVHVRETLFHRPTDALPIGALVGPDALNSAAQALSAHLDATGGGVVNSVTASGVHATNRPVHGSPLVSIVIPTRGSLGNVRGKERSLVVDCIRSIVEKSTYGNYELIVVIDTVADPAVVDEIVKLAGDRLRLVWWDLPFNFSAKMNRGVFESQGEYVLFLNDDTEVISPGWIEPMLSLVQLPGGGMSGGMLYFEDESIQHAGHIYEAGDAGHVGVNDMRGARGPAGSYLVEREVSGVTAACSMMPRKVFDEVGGFSLLLPGNFNDVDLCMKVNQLGYTIYWTPRSELYHYESKTRVSRVARYEVETAWGRWEWKLDDATYWPYGGLPSADELTAS